MNETGNEAIIAAFKDRALLTKDYQELNESPSLLIELKGIDHILSEHGPGKLPSANFCFHTLVESLILKGTQHYLGRDRFPRSSHLPVHL